jgi:hypothetical protein
VNSEARFRRSRALGPRPSHCALGMLLFASRLDWSSTTCWTFPSRRTPPCIATNRTDAYCLVWGFRCQAEFGLFSRARTRGRSTSPRDHRSRAMRGARDGPVACLSSRGSSSVHCFRCSVILCPAATRLAEPSAEQQDEPREPARAREPRAATLYSVGPLEILTMKQPCASAAGLRGGGPILIAVLEV